MAENEDDSSKTEEPSHKKLEDARKKGQMVSSREINHFFIILALTFFIMGLAPGTGAKLLDQLTPYITQPDQFEVSAAGVSDTMRHAFIGMLLVLLLPILATFTAAIAPSIVQNKWAISAESIKPKWEKVSPLAGVKRLFSMKAFVEFGKNLLKVSVIGIVCAMIALSYRNDLHVLPSLHHTGMLEFTQIITGKMLLAACIILFMLSIADYLWQRHLFLKQMRMSKQELKDEYKQQEGDPHVKGKLKQIRREKAKQRMMANVPKADVIITNPTHYAVALQYDADTMPAPKLVAKGADEVAARIRELATKNKVPIVRNPPLARVLYDTTDIDDEIPVEHYAAVAKVIGYVYKLKGKKAPAGAAGGTAGAKPGGKPTPMKLHMPNPKKK